MRVVNLGQEAEAAIENLDAGSEVRVSQYKDAVARIRKGIEATAPIELMYVKNVRYDTKTDRYLATFTSGDGQKSSTLKVSNEVAEFLTTNLHLGAGSWHGRMANGVLVDAYMIRI